MRKINPQKFIHRFINLILFVSAAIMILAFVVQIDQTVDCEGVIVPQNKVNYYSQLNGTIKKILVKSGQMVTQGQVLLKIDDFDMKYELQSMLIEYKISEMRYQQDREKITRAYHSKKKLYDKKMISYNDYLQAKQDYELLKIKSLELKKMKLSIAKLSNEIEKTVIKSAKDGRIVFDEDKLIPGMYLHVGEELFTHVDYRQSKMVAEILIPESESSYVKLSNRVRIFMNAFPYTKYQVINGKLIYMSPISENGFVKGKVLLEKEGVLVDGVFRHLSYGMTLKAKISVSKEPIFYKLTGIKKNAIH